MQRLANWMFAGWARPALTLLTLGIAVTVLHRHLSDGLAAFVGVMGLALFSFLKVVDRMSREPETRPAAMGRRKRRIARTLWWRRHILSLAEHDRGPQGDRARRIVATWKEAEKKEKP